MFGKIENAFRYYAWIMDRSWMDIRNAGIDILILGIFCGFIVSLLSLLITKVSGKRTAAMKIGLVCCLTNVLMCAPIVSRLPKNVYRLEKILSNASYLLGMENNRTIFFQSLAIPDTQVNREQIGYIIYYMNDSEWKRAEEAAGSMQWYLESIHGSLDRTIKVFGIHLGKTVWQQHAVSYVLLLFLCLVCYLFFLHKNWESLSFLFLLSMIVFCFCCPCGTAFFCLAQLISFGAFWKCSKYVSCRFDR